MLKYYFLLLGIVALAGCSKEPAAPKTIAVEEATNSLDKTFKAASIPSQQLATEANSAIATKNYGQAVDSLQALSSRTDLTAQQQQAAARSLQAVNKQVAERAAAGDLAAQEAQKKYRATK